ncbi:Ubiquitin-like protein MDY2 [Candida viswanathii]|uniref:Ubiquitin-like protein MDY2 n=1 Tax=Candida viswanathii TaxID=5486 RepID=A0A367YGF8_9ASCO|nr:Ubiquitin-like protein MDY2 [Candida viswanathii]
MSTATISNLSNEKQFIDTYLQLMQLAKNEPLDKFNSTQDYNKLESLGPSLPKFTYNFPTVERKSVQVSTADLKFKSIKPPFKFQVELTGIPVNYTIYKVKEKLIESVEALQGVTPADLKLLVKSKVVQDSTVLSTLEDTSFNCMVSAPKVVKQEEVAPAVVAGPTISWDKIHDIILHDVKDDTRAKEIVDRFKSTI